MDFSENKTRYIVLVQNINTMISPNIYIIRLSDFTDQNTKLHKNFKKLA